MGVPLFAIALGLAQFSPLLTRWLNSKNGDSIAAKIVDIAQKVTNAADPLEAVRMLRSNANLAESFKDEVAELELAIINDRQQARMRDVTLAQSGRYNWRSDVMVASAAIGLIVCLISLGYSGENLRGEAVGIISMIAGIFGACLKDAYSFEFGSSRSSRNKDVAISSLLERNGW